MPSLKDILLEISDTFGSEELKDIANNNGVQELTIDDDIVQSISEKIKGSKDLLSLDAAKNNPDIIEHVRAQLKPQMRRDLLNNVDTELLEASKELFGEDVVNELSETQSTFDKVKKFREYTKNKITSGSSDSKLKELNEKLKNQMKELQGNFQKSIEEKEKEIAKAKDGYTRQVIDMKFDQELSSYELGEDYTKDFVKKALYADVKSKVMEQAKLTIDDKGNIVPKNPKGEEMDLFVGNKQVTSLKELIDPVIEPFTKKITGNKTQATSDYRPSMATDTSKLSAYQKDLLKRKNTQLEM